MIVLRLTTVPYRLRGELTRWLYEIDPNVFVGVVSARIRDSLWDRVLEDCGINSSAWMVFQSNTIQHLEFRSWNTRWTTVDFDGISLIERPLSTP